jgi:hypothetical protein
MKFDVSTLAPYAKTVVAVLGVALLAAKALLDGTVTSDEIQSVAIAAAAALGVYHVPNKG